MKKIIIIPILFFCITVIIAQQDPLAKAVLDKVSQKVNSYSSMKVKYVFEQKDLKTGDEHSQKGEIILKGAMYKINLDSSEIFCDGKTMWTYLKTVKEVNVLPVGNSNKKGIDLTNPKNLFTFYNKDFKYDYIGEEIINGVPCHKIDLYPITMNTNYSRIRILVDKAKDEILLVKIFTKNGNNYIFKIVNLTSNIDAPDELFRFNPDANPGVEVIDMRMK